MPHSWSRRRPQRAVAMLRAGVVSQRPGRGRYRRLARSGAARARSRRAPRAHALLGRRRRAEGGHRKRSGPTSARSRAGALAGGIAPVRTIRDYRACPTLDAGIRHSATQLDRYRRRCCSPRALSSHGRRAVSEEVVRAGTVRSSERNRAPLGYRAARIDEFDPAEQRRVKETCARARGELFYYPGDQP